MDIRMERLLEAARIVEIDDRDIADIYSVYQFTGIKAAANAMSSLFSDRGEYAPDLDDLEDDDFLDNY